MHGGIWRAILGLLGIFTLAFLLMEADSALNWLEDLVARWKRRHSR